MDGVLSSAPDDPSDSRRIAIHVGFGWYSFPLHGGGKSAQMFGKHEQTKTPPATPAT